MASVWLDKEEGPRSIQLKNLSLGKLWKLSYDLIFCIYTYTPLRLIKKSEKNEKIEKKNQDFSDS